MKFLNALVCALVLFGVLACALAAEDQQSLTSNAPTTVDSTVFLESDDDDDDSSADDDAQDAADDAAAARAASSATAPVGGTKKKRIPTRFVANPNKPKPAPKSPTANFTTPSTVDEALTQSNNLLSQLTDLTDLRNKLSKTMENLVDHLKLPQGILKGINKELADKSKDLKSLKEELANLKKREGVVQGKIDALEARISALTAQADLQKGPLAQIQNAIKKIKAQLASLQKLIDDAKSNGK